MFKKILIANRGEIALRIIRACKELGIKTVAAHSDIDAGSLPVRFADEDVCIGPPDSSLSYRNIPNIISAAEITNSDAIHPGYGFLAENAHFAEVCESVGIVFIGPSPENIELMGDKAKAREIMRKNGVPIMPGSEGILPSEKEAFAVARKIRYPVIIKASAGGGGKGMRVVNNEKELQHAFQMARAEAKASFGDDEVYIEKYFVNPRHIEIQIMADNYGKVVYLGERDCSIQRRHQKIIEETPSPVVDTRLRTKMGRIAVAVAKSIGYRNVGTVEFLLDKNHNFYFIEMNTRIQVEHPITEMVTDIDLIKEQIRISAGEPMKFKQNMIRMHGHSIECRINAECPDTFAPSPGLITAYHRPGGLGIRVDDALYNHYKVPPYYDSLIAKLIAYGTTREDAIIRMKRALDEYIIDGINTTISLHQRILEDPSFQQGKYSTKYIERFLSR
ncbi:MAG: acetyl-CoA carboxylase biotin carboxylase subunit [Nitrospirota bacterium]